MTENKEKDLREAQGLTGIDLPPLMVSCGAICRVCVFREATFSTLATTPIQSSVCSEGLESLQMGSITTLCLLAALEYGPKIVPTSPVPASQILVECGFPLWVFIGRVPS